MLFILIVLIWRKSKELEDYDATNKISSKSFTHPPKIFQEGTTSILTKYSYKGTKKATNNFSTAIGQGGFGIYKYEFKDGSVVAVKRMNKVSEQHDYEFCREIELLARLHHRQLVSLWGFCTERLERFLMYEYMPNGSLKDQLHNPGTTPLSWHTRTQIAIDVANTSVADFGLAHALNDGFICFEPVKTEIKGTLGYMDPEYVITQELIEKSMNKANYYTNSFWTSSSSDSFWLESIYDKKPTQKYSKSLTSRNKKAQTKLPEDQAK
ncbi:probable receptor-like protein kinase At1g49730 [Solanum pennellii]|uniref:Probable receptor-like protein kinase At1g49730 n=1 Tax=Solanum pennellii TaxID=28526 RepID=A0ABM1V1V1_SOLPN|nr:probable receptor-like protein kinase At1g49730 [Solanum pennellii]